MIPAFEEKMEIQMKIFLPLKHLGKDLMKLQILSDLSNAVVLGQSIKWAIQPFLTPRV